MARPVVTRAIWIAALLVGLTAILYARLLISSHEELLAAERLSPENAQTRLEKIEHDGRAARLYAPLNPYSARAIERLRAECWGPPPTAREVGRSDVTELAACRELRSAILATRSIYTPNRDLLEAANRKIALLSAKLESPSVDPNTDEAGRMNWHLELLNETYEPKLGWTLLALAGFVLFLGSAIAFFYRGLDANDRLRGQAAIGFLVGVVAGFASMLVGLARA